MTSCCSTCRWFMPVKRNGTVFQFQCPLYGECRAGKVGTGYYEYSVSTARTWERWVRERKP